MFLSQISTLISLWPFHLLKYLQVNLATFVFYLIFVHVDEKHFWYVIGLGSILIYLIKLYLADAYHEILLFYLGMCERMYFSSYLVHRWEWDLIGFVLLIFRNSISLMFNENIIFIEIHSHPWSSNLNYVFMLLGFVVF